MVHVRNYKPDDYDKVVALCMNGKTFGGELDEARDSREKLAEVTRRDPESILVYERNSKILGTVSLIEDGRVAWLFRFAIQEVEERDEIAESLYEAATKILIARGHSQVLVYSDPQNEVLDRRYNKTLGMIEGGLFRCFWQEIG
jgi:predicted N-acetyltransferase YhbS